jgi:hypothetical protein
MFVLGGDFVSSLGTVMKYVLADALSWCAHGDVANLVHVQNRGSR